MPAGIVLQAYLPESHAVFAQLLAWARTRREQGGAPIKVRIVKGANLAMETAEGQLHGWTPAPYGSKADVDASWKRLVDAALRPENADAVRVGIASHNLFDLAWSLEVAAARGVSSAGRRRDAGGDGQRRGPGDHPATWARSCSTRRSPPATTSPPPSPTWSAASTRTPGPRTSCGHRSASRSGRPRSPSRSTASATPWPRGTPCRPSRDDMRRRAARQPRHRSVDAAFGNEPETDLTRPDERALIAAALDRHASGWDRPLPVVVAGVERDAEPDDVLPGRNPSAEGATWYSYSVATQELVDEAVASARGASRAGMRAGPATAARILWEAARVMAEELPDTLAVMSLDAGQDRGTGHPRGDRGHRLRPLLRSFGDPDARGRGAQHARGRRGRGAPVELPVRDPGRRGHRRPGRGQRRHPQARARDGGHGMAAGQAAVAGGRAPRGAPVRADPRRRGRPAPGDPSGRGRGHPHRLVRRPPGCSPPGAPTCACWPRPRARTPC